MIASCSGGGLEMGTSEEEEDPSANVISDFIYQGANLHNQTDRTGETALHLAARYARSDAAVQDNMGRTPLHAAIAADAQGVFQILLRNRDTDVNAKMNDGTTPLMLAARQATEGMVGELLAAGVDISAVDDAGKTALHWAAAVNNIEAVQTLLNKNATIDAQDHKDETPLFLAAREGCHDVCRLLLDNFANRNIGDNMDRQPEDIAKEKNHKDIVRLLEDHHPRSPRELPMLSQTQQSPQPHCRSLTAPRSKQRRQKPSQAQQQHIMGPPQPDIIGTSPPSVGTSMSGGDIKRTSSMKKKRDPPLPPVVTDPRHPAFNVSSHVATSAYGTLPRNAPQHFNANFVNTSLAHQASKQQQQQQQLQRQQQLLLQQQQQQQLQR